MLLSFLEGRLLSILLSGRVLEKQFGGAFFLFLHIVNEPLGEHDMHMGVALTAPHSTDFVMDGVGVIVIAEMSFQKLVHNFPILIYVCQLIGQGKLDFPVSPITYAFIAVSRRKKLLGAVLRPFRQLVSLVDAPAALGKGFLPVDVLHMSGSGNKIHVCLGAFKDFLRRLMG